MSAGHYVRLVWPGMLCRRPGLADFISCIVVHDRFMIHKSHSQSPESRTSWFLRA